MIGPYVMMAARERDPVSEAGASTRRSSGFATGPNGLRSLM